MLNKKLKLEDNYKCSIANGPPEPLPVKDLPPKLIPEATLWQMPLLCAVRRSHAVSNGKLSAARCAILVRAGK